MKRASVGPFEILAGASLSRTVIPPLPPHYLSRKHLFHLLENEGASTTVLIAPTGFGKTSLVAEWAGNQDKKVIWLTLTESDSLADMSALFIQATRNAVPGFGTWFENHPELRPVEIVKRWGNELLTSNEQYIFVIDNLRKKTARDVDIASRLVEQFPPNVQFVTIRQDSIETVYATFAARGPLKVVGKTDLIFSKDEIRLLGKTLNLNLSKEALDELVNSTQGWPAACSLLLHEYARNGKPANFELIAASSSDPLKSLVRSVIDQLDPKKRSIITSLSVLSEFSHDQARVILDKEYSYDAINQIALDGNLFRQTGNPELTFEFSPLVREILLVDLRQNLKTKEQIHSRLFAFHESRNEPNLALEHAYLSGNFEKVAEIFPDAARILQATGQGNTLLRWSIFAGDSSKTGRLKRATVELAGYMANQDIRSALNLVSHMIKESKGTELEGFITQITSAAKAHIQFALGQFSDFEISLKSALQPNQEILQLGIEEQVCLLRLSSMKAFIFDEAEKIEENIAQAQLIAGHSKIPQNHLMISAIQAMHLFQIGEYKKAYEIANINSSQFSRLNYVGCFAPLDSLFVMARCLLEFARPREAKAKFAQVSALAEKWGEWSWHFMAEGYLARELAVDGEVAEALEAVKLAHHKVSEIEFSHELSGIIDLSELFIRYQVKDYDRLGVLLNRAPKVRFVQQIKLSYDEKMGKKTVREEIKRLPFRTPREKIWKHLADASEVIDQEQIAMYEMKKALEVGASVGAKETFLRQSDAMGNLIIKLAGENPTVYLEDLASSVVERLKSRSTYSQFKASLTKREIEVLRHLSTDRTINSIATSLHISINTMKTHLKNLYRKMEVENRQEAVAKAKSHFVL